MHRASPAAIRSCNGIAFALTLLTSPILAQMGPDNTPGEAEAAAAVGPEIPAGPFAPTWESLRDNYHTPPWLLDGKFGIFLHWGLYAVPAHQSEWYQRHMYGTAAVREWHVQNFGPLDRFGYKDFIPRFTCEHFRADEWAALFKQAGARFVVPTAQHHDNFALWDSALTKIDAKDLGPKRDLIGELATAVRRQGLKFGVSNHGMENFTFIRGVPDDRNTDLFDPAWQDIYHYADRSPAARVRFLEDWVARNVELIDKYQPDMLWFDNGINDRSLDPVKLKVAAYYYNRAVAWGKDVTISSKHEGYLYGTVLDFERQQRGAKSMQVEFWQVDDSVHQRWGYLTDARYWNVHAIVWRLIENVSKNGGLLLNFSPKADGTIPEEQQALLRGIGAWLDVNGEAIYGTRPWVKFGEGEVLDNRAPGYTAKDIRFTTKGNTLYAIVMGWPTDGAGIVITSLGLNESILGDAMSVSLLGHREDISFTRDTSGLKVELPATPPGEHAWVLKIDGFKLR